MNKPREIKLNTLWVKKSNRDQNGSTVGEKNGNTRSKKYIYYLENQPNETSATKLLTNPIGKSAPSNLVTEQPAPVLLTINTVGSEHFSVGIVHSFRNHRASENYPTIQPTIEHYKQATGWGKID